MVKMVGSAYGMAISDQNRRFSSIILDAKIEDVLESGRDKHEALFLLFG